MPLNALLAADGLPCAEMYRWDPSTPVIWKPLAVNQAETDWTAASVGSNRARYASGVRKWR